MQRVDTATAVAEQPAQNPAGTPGYFTQGNPASGLPATVPGQDWYNNIQEELVNAILGAGLELDKTAQNQLLKAIQRYSRYAVAAGADNAYAVALTPALDAYIEGMPIVFKANHDCTGAVTLAVNGMAAKAIKRVAADINPGDIKNGQIICVVYDGTNFQIMNPPNEVGVPFLVFAETPPNGTLEADGASLLRASYPALFAKYGTSYGAADETHFNLPDMRGRFPRIWAHGQATDPDRATRTAPGATGATLVAGDHVGTEQAEAYKQHQHSLTTYGNDIDTAGKVGAGNSSVTVSTAYTTNEGGNETRPVNTAMMMVIRY